jgi:5S rRNA maturation endonuclease (ribonuclease M5)
MYYTSSMLNTQKTLPSILDVERAERLREVFELLHDINENVPVIIEGKKDFMALRDLGLNGEIIKLHGGKNLYDFCDDITLRFDRVILLLDWDKKGEQLNKTLSMHLKGHWEEFSSFRELLKLLCQKEISHIEGIPKLLRRLEGNENTWQEG